MVDKYDEDIICWNCGWLNQFRIPLGVTVDKYLDENKCSKCDCHCRMK